MTPPGSEGRPVGQVVRRDSSSSARASSSCASVHFRERPTPTANNRRFLVASKPDGSVVIGEKGVERNHALPHGRPESRILAAVA